MAEKKYQIQIEVEGIDDLDGLLERQRKLAAEIEDVACQIRFVLHGINARLASGNDAMGLENYIHAGLLTDKTKEIADQLEEGKITLNQARREFGLKPIEDENADGPVILKRKILRAEDTVELKEVRHCDEANLLLDKGWNLRAVSVGCYIMSRPRDAEQ